MWTSWRNKFQLTLGIVFLFSPAAKAALDHCNVFTNTTVSYVAGVSTDTVFINCFDSSGPPASAEVVTVELLDGSNVISNGVAPTSFTTVIGQTNYGLSTLPFTFFRASTALQVRVTPTGGGAGDTSSPAFTVVRSSATKLLLLATGMTYAPGTNPSLTAGFTGAATHPDVDQPFLLTTILTDSSFNTVSGVHQVTFDSSPSFITLPTPNPDNLVAGILASSATITAARTSRTITVTSTDTAVSAGHVTVTTAGPPEDEVFAYPSPFNPKSGSITFEFRVLQSKDATLKVKNQFGQGVWETTVSAVGQVTKPVTWDGKNEKGETVAAGIYYVLLEIDGSIKSKKRFGVVK